MSLAITRGYLRARLIFVMLAFIGALLASSAFMLYTLEQEKTKVKFSAALGTMAELTSDLLYSSAQLENASRVYTLTLNSGGHGQALDNLIADGQAKLKDAKARFSDDLRRLTHLFQALQWSADGDITANESQRLSAEETGDALFTADAGLSSIVAHIEGHTMPDALRPMWSGDGNTNLKRDIGELISQSNRLDIYHDLSGSTAARTFRQLNNLVDKRIKSGLARTLDHLHNGMISSYLDLQNILIASALIMIAFSLAIALLVLMPMARRVSEAHRQLIEANRKFEDARDRAESSDRAKSEFLANMSHEIRTPMNGVLGMAELLAKTDLDTRQQTFTDIIVKSGNALLTIINDILDFSKIDANQLELDSEPFRLSEAVEDVAALVSTGAAEKDLELIVRVDPALPEYVVGDIGRVRQILTNLLGNAVKFTEVGHVLIDVSGATSADGDSAALTISIEDTGVGIPEDKIDAVFTKFSQVDASSTRRHEGTGLGLAIASRLVGLMGGQIELESTIGKGTRFWFTIELPVRASEGSTKVPPIDVSDARIFVIDDNAVNRSILLEQLSSWKFDCAASASGKEGLQELLKRKAAGGKTDCVILDYQMPEMNGEEVAKEIRSNPELADIPVVLLTSVDQADFSRLINDVRLSACLTKPARSSVLFDTLISVLRKDRLSKGVEAPPAELAVADMVEEGAQDAEAGKDLPVHTSSPVDELETDDQATKNNSKPDQSGADVENDDKSSASASGDVSQPGGRLAAMAERMRRERETGHKAQSAEAHAPGPSRPPLDEQLDILVAEDNEVNQKVFTEILDEIGLNYLIVGNGKRAVDMHAKRRPGIILMDVSMPEMNGLEATRAIRDVEQNDTTTHTPIIGVTAHALKGDRERCLNAGMDDYVSKPVSTEKLDEVIKRWLHDNKHSALAS